MGDAQPPPDRWFPVLVKLLLTLIVVLFLAAILFPLTVSDGRGSKRTVQLSNIKQVGLCLVMYANDYDDRMPPAMSTSDELRRYSMPYLKEAAILVSINPAGGELLGNGLLAGKKAGDIAKPAATVMVFDSRPWAGDYGLVCYADGHAKATIPFETMLQQLTVDPFAVKKGSRE